MVESGALLRMGSTWRRNRSMKLSKEDQEFVKHYDDSKYAKPSVTADMVIFAYDGKQREDLQVLLIRRGRPPFQNQYALPGGFVNPDESVDDAAQRELLEETGVACGCLEQLRTFSTPGRDPRRWVITCAYLALVEQSQVCVKAGDDAKAAEWFRVRLTAGENTQSNPDYLEMQGSETESTEQKCLEQKNLEQKNTEQKCLEQKNLEQKDIKQKYPKPELSGQAHLWNLELQGENETIEIPFWEKQIPGRFTPELSLKESENGLAFDHALILAYAVMKGKRDFSFVL
ncbi:NUDIX hydrolase [Clostridium sp. OM02-18AC]|nr:NUDIX hydrolase [Clostridium sp. OM02-18AC]